MRTIIQHIGPLYGEPNTGSVFGQPNGSVAIGQGFAPAPSPDPTPIDPSVPPTEKEIWKLNYFDSGRYIGLIGSKIFCSKYSTLSEGSYNLAQFELINSEADLSNKAVVQLATDSEFKNLFIEKTYPSGTYSASGIELSTWSDNQISSPTLNVNDTLYLRVIMRDPNGAYLYKKSNTLEYKWGVEA